MSRYCGRHPGTRPLVSVQSGLRCARPSGRAYQHTLAMTASAQSLHHGVAQSEAYKSEYVFGFGSLIGNPGFEYSDKVEPCYIKGWRRVFWQGSTDHRGTPEAPGRTVTLEPCEGAVTWGAAYKIAGDAEQRQETITYLEWREKQYDLREIVPVFTDASSSQPHVTALVYIATSDRSANPNYLGPAPLDDIALQIATSVGPSGPNRDYLFALAASMRRMNVQDEELFLLEAKVRALLDLPGNGDSSSTAAAAAGVPIDSSEPS
ncbi:hypothetical protein D9Q98_000853 [Chlorella vulgaris]|uniref:glutathione-specific gamma-glutamylcyclotransferase n=1 Tax=Chlorella vulgaris TaxID=3077 RepID=A0A9D4TZ48_CHLVU|nr:hypothetical protein D9Q98_000853 [Chlorella vulgaris]